MIDPHVDPLTAALRAAEAGTDAADIVARFLRALPYRGVVLGGGTIDQPRRIADEVERTAGAKPHG
jgi:hypothetical protein